MPPPRAPFLRSILSSLPPPSRPTLHPIRTLSSPNRGPPSHEETQTDFGSLNVLREAPAPATAIDACLSDEFHLGNGVKIRGGSGCLLVGGEAFTWRPWLARKGGGGMITSRPIRTLSSPNRGPTSHEETQTDFGSLNVLANAPAPATAIDACLSDEFHLGNGVKIRGSGCLLVGGEAFSWRPWLARKGGGTGRMINNKGQWEVEREAWGVLDVAWPKPGE